MHLNKYNKYNLMIIRITRLNFLVSKVPKTNVDIKFFKWSMQLYLMVASSKGNITFNKHSIVVV